MLNNDEKKEIIKIYKTRKKICEEEAYKPTEKLNSGLIRIIIGIVVIVIFLGIISFQSFSFRSEVCLLNLVLGLGCIVLFFAGIVGGISKIFGYFKDIKFYAKFFSWFYDTEQFFLIHHLDKIGMKHNIKEKDFITYLDFNQKVVPEPLRFKKTEKEKLLKTFKKIKKRVNKIDISKKCKSDYTPWEFFRIHFFDWFIQKNIQTYRKYGQVLPYNYDFKIANINLKDVIEELDIYEKLDFYKIPISGSSKSNDTNFSEFDITKWCLYFQVLTFFQEFERAPRITGDLVIQLEDTLDKVKKISDVSKGMILPVVESWRKYKTEIAFQ